MKIIKKIIILGLVVFLVIFVSAYIFVRLNGRQLIISKLSTALHRHVDVGDVGVVFPLSLSVKDLKMDGYGYVKKAVVGLGVFHLLGKNLGFSSLVLTEPQLIIHKTKDAGIIFGDLPEVQMPQETNTEAVPPQESAGQENAGSPVQTQKSEDKKEDTPRFSVDKLVIHNGAVNFFDHSSGEHVFRLTIKNINLKARDISLSSSAPRTTFDLTAALLGREEKVSGGRIESRGWFNFAKKDMKGYLTVTDLDGRIFSPYYDNANGKGLTTFVADLTANLESKANDMTVRGKLKVKELAFKAAKEKDSGSFSVEDLILGGLQSLAKEITINYHFKTKMDDFKLESLSFSGNIFSPMPNKIGNGP